MIIQNYFIYEFKKYINKMYTYRMITIQLQIQSRITLFVYLSIIRLMQL